MPAAATIFADFGDGRRFKKNNDHVCGEKASEAKNCRQLENIWVA